jgi:hypothetical protein
MAWLLVLFYITNRSTQARLLVLFFITNKPTLPLATISYGQPHTTLFLEGYMTATTHPL